MMMGRAWAAGGYGRAGVGVDVCVGYVSTSCFSCDDDQAMSRRRDMYGGAPRQYGVRGAMMYDDVRR